MPSKIKTQKLKNCPGAETKSGPGGDLWSPVEIRGERKQKTKNRLKNGQKTVDECRTVCYSKQVRKDSRSFFYAKIYILSQENNEFRKHVEVAKCVHKSY